MKNFIIISMLAIAVIGINSCEKKGCTDPTAKNYNSSAKSNDGSCTYQAQVIFWFDSTKAAAFIAGNVTSLTYTLADSVVGTSGTNVYFAVAPSCGANGAVTITKQLGGNSSASYPLVVTDQAGNTVFSVTLTLAAATPCFQVQLI